jgi:HD-like signal output (HDOD) protein
MAAKRPGEDSRTHEHAMTQVSMNAEIAVDEELWFGSPGEDKELEERASKSMAAVAARVLGAKPFPPAARKLEELTRAGGAKIEQVVGVLESDPGLSMRLLRLVNSAGYALRVRCTSVRHAAALVGMRRLHQLATTAAVLDLFETNSPSVKSLLSHAAVVGAFCRYIAVHVDLAPDELFTCGFLHDIGKLMLIDAEGDSYLALVEQAGEAPDALYLLEQEKYGFDHAVLGAHVLKNWRIPNPVPRVVAWHHNVARAYQADPAIAAMVQALRLADQLSYLVRTHSEADGVLAAAQSPAAAYLGMSEAQLSSMWSDLSRLSQRIISPGNSDQAEVIPREDSIPPSLRPRDKARLTHASFAPTHSLAPAGRSVSDVPKHFVCVVCQKASFGNRCPICSGHVCAEHQVGAEQWCTECSAAYAVEVGRHAFPLWERLTALGIVVGAGLLSLMVALLAGRPVLGALFGSVLLSTLCVLLVLVGRRFWLKKVFFQTRARAHDEHAHALPLGLTMPPEPSIALLSDAPDVTMRPTERINPPAARDGLPALFSVAPTALDASRSPAAPAAPGTLAPPVSVPPVPVAPRGAAPLSPYGSNGSEAPQHSLRPATSPAPLDARPEPKTDAAAESELPTHGWRPVERTEPALPLSRRAQSNDLRRLAEALPSIPPAAEQLVQAGHASVPAAAAPAEPGEPRRSVTEPVPAPAPAPALRTAPLPPAVAAQPRVTLPFGGEPHHADAVVVPPQAPVPDVEALVSVPASCEPLPETSSPAPLFVPEACNAVSPGLLVACRPLSLRPRHYACSPAGGR